jgi:nicotinate-nucleotide adenylyltransferase
LRYGIFGGTFNPVHNGHMINAQLVLERYDLDKILFIPSKIPVHKHIDCGVSADDRYEMLRLATVNNSSFSVSRIELDSEMPSYTIYTVEKLLNEHEGAGLYLIMGDDAFNEISSWKEYKRLLSMLTVIVMTREPGKHLDLRDIGMEQADVRYIENPLIDISSTCIRKRVQERKTIRYMVPKEVEDYIMSRELYYP